MKVSYSLHKITDEDQCPFDAKEYSWFKFGDKQYAEKFANELFTSFIEEFGDLLLSKNEIVFFQVLICRFLQLPIFYVFTLKMFK